MKNIKLIQGDCLEVMKDIPDGSIDMILTDPPFNVTACKWEWDIMTRIDEFWEQWKRIIKENGVIVIFGIEPFSSKLRVSNLGIYKYDFIWEKEMGTGFARSNKQPLRKHENISVFYSKQPFYNSVGKKLKKPYRHTLPIYKSKSDNVSSENLNEDEKRIYKEYHYSKKNSILRFARDPLKLHPTQKPVKLLEYLIKTYTLKNETILDCFMGSGSTIIAALNTDRKAIGIELDKDYFKIVQKRIKDHLGLFAD